jgi:hypothetical protein
MGAERPVACRSPEGTAFPDEPAAARERRDHAPDADRVFKAPVGDGGDMATTLTGYGETRRQRCQRIVRTGVMLSRFGAGVGAGPAQTVRNAVLRLTPPGPLLRFGAPIVRWTPP